MVALAMGLYFVFPESVSLKKKGKYVHIWQVKVNFQCNQITVWLDVSKQGALLFLFDS